MNQENSENKVLQQAGQGKNIKEKQHENKANYKLIREKKKKKIIKPLDHYYFSSEFKQNFIKGALLFVKNRTIQDTILMLRQISSTLYLPPSQMLVWVKAFLIIIKINKQTQNRQLLDEELLQMIGEQVYLMICSKEKKQALKQIKETQLKKVILTLFKEIPIINRPNINSWYLDFMNIYFYKSDSNDHELKEDSQNDEEMKIMSAYHYGNEQQAVFCKKPNNDQQNQGIDQEYF